jgi:hypothetical protein
MTGGAVPDAHVEMKAVSVFPRLDGTRYAFPYDSGWHAYGRVAEAKGGSFLCPPVPLIIDGKFLPHPIGLRLGIPSVEPLYEVVRIYS